MLTENQCDDEVIALQNAYPFAIEDMNFQLYKSSFAGTIFYKKKQEEIIYQLKELAYFWKQLRKHKCSGIICSVSNPELLLFLFLSPVKVFYILHTVAVHPLHQLKRKILNHCLSLKKQIITVSQFAKNNLLQNWTSGQHENFIKLIYNFYEPQTHQITFDKLPGKKVLTVGTVAHYKNPFFWIDVCKEVIKNCDDDSVEFIWAGDGELLQECKNLVRDIPQIKFIGYQKNIDQLYQSCTIYFQPSIFESHGIAVLGAMYFKKPCIVSDRQGLPESVVDNETGFIVSMDDTVMAAGAIISLLNCPEKAAALGESGKKRFEENFTKSKWTDEMSIVFN